MAKLTVKFKGKVIREIRLTADSKLTIGRDQTNDLQLDNPAISRFHAIIYKHLWPFYVEDLKSTNGIYLNGTMLRWKSTIKNNDIITIDKYELVFNATALDYEKDKGEPFNPDATIKV
jgi:pSer/pThr/pTyr-binding forkhead associated (FHA) protein